MISLWKNKHFTIPFILSLILAGLMLLGAYKEGYRNGYIEANLKAQDFTKKAIQNLSNKADSAVINFLDCADNDRVWDFANNKCTNTAASTIGPSDSRDIVDRSAGKNSE